MVTRRNVLKESVKKIFLITAGYRFRTIIGFYPNASIYMVHLNVHAHRRAPGFSRCQAELLIALTRSISRAVIQTTHPIFDTSYPPVRAADVFPMPMKGDAASPVRVCECPECARSVWIRDNTESASGTDTIPH